MIPEHLPEEDHGLGVIRVLTNCALLGSAIIAFLLGGRSFSAGVLIAGFLMAVFGYGMHLIQKRVYNIVLYYLAQLALFALTLVLLAFLVPAPDGTRPDLFLIVMAAILGIVSIGAATHARIRGVRLFYPVIYFIFYPVAIYLMSFVFGNPELRALAYFVEAFFIILYLFYQNCRSLVRAFFEAKGYANVPYEKIRRSNRRKMLGLAGLSMLLLLVISFFDNGGALLLRIAARIQDFLRWLVTLLSRFKDENTLGTGTDEMVRKPFYEIGEFLPEAEANASMEAFWNMVILIMTILAAVIIALILVKAVKEFLREFRLSKRENNDVSVYVPPQEKSERKSHKGNRLSFFDRSPNTQARRLYLQFIKRQPKSSQVRAFETPFEIEETAGARLANAAGAQVLDFPFAGTRETANAVSPVQAIHELYERARYAPEGITSDDVRSMKTAIRAAEAERNGYWTQNRE